MLDADDDEKNETGLEETKRLYLCLFVEVKMLLIFDVCPMTSSLSCELLHCLLLILVVQSLSVFPVSMAPWPRFP